jgi:hypothetical protein
MATAWQRRRFYAAAGFFALWTGWLAYEAATTSKVVVVSRPQCFQAPHQIEAEVPDRTADTQKVTLIKVYWGEKLLLRGPEAGGAPVTVQVSGLDHARGWQGPGTYLLALRPEVTEEIRGGERFAVVPTPVSPGFLPRRDAPEAQPAIYPATASTRTQVEVIARQRQAGP